MKSQNATATIGNPTACAGDTILVPVDVTNFIDVGAMTMYIGYDTNTAEFLSLQNINSAIAGWVSYNATNNQVGIAYSSLSPFNITSGKIFDLRFRFLGDSTLLPFNPGTEIANSNLQLIPLDPLGGSIANSIYLINQPDSVQSYPDNDVIFRVTSLGTPSYQWQENSGSGWTSLQNNATYSGVNNDTLYIYDVDLGFNLNEYRCILSAGNCTVTSGTGLLEVALAFPAATLGLPSSCPEQTVYEPLYVGDFLDVTEFIFNISFDTDQLQFNGLTNVHPDLLPGNLAYSSLVNPTGISITWDHTSSISIASGKLFDLELAYGNQNQALAFAEGTQVFNSLSNPINITLSNGMVFQLETPMVTGQPQNDTVLEGQTAQFNVMSTETATYQWQISIDEGSTWDDLAVVPPYFNVQSSSMTINPAVFAMNGHQFRCLLASEYCSTITEAAVLTVDTLTGIKDIPAAVIKFGPNPFSHAMHLDFAEHFFCDFIRIYSTEGKMVLQYEKTGNIPERKISLMAPQLRQGLYILDISGRYNGKVARQYFKIIKTD